MPPANQNQTPNYNFITQNSQAPKSRFNLPKLPKPFGLILTITLGVFFLIIVYALVFGGNTKTSGLSDIAAQAQEISRVSALVRESSDDPTIDTTATTTQSVMAGNVSQIQKYVSNNGGKKISTKLLAARRDSAVDAKIKSAVTSNTLPDYYNTYLKAALSQYMTSLQTSYKTANTKAKTMLNDFYASSQIIFNSL